MLDECDSYFDEKEGHPVRAQRSAQLRVLHFGVELDETRELLVFLDEQQGR